jgi:hypothetical protein
MENKSDSSEGDGTGSKPSLERLAKRVARRRDQEPPGSDSEDDEQASPNTTPSEESEFRFPADEATTLRDDFGADAKTDALVDLVGDTPNLLLLGPVSCRADYDLCSKLIGTAGDDLANLLLVTYTESPDTRLDILEGHIRHSPGNVVVLSVGGSTRSRSGGTGQIGSGKSPTIETISDATNVQRLGITISQYIAEWGSTDGETLVCFHSLDPLLQAVEDTQRAFRFLNTLFGRIQSANAYAHYHMDPDAHDQETISTFRPMFDEIVTFDEEGTLQVDHES